jgi:hypothetical protein
MRSWGTTVGNLGKALWATVSTYPQLLVDQVAHVGNPITFYPSSLRIVPSFFHGKNLVFQSVNATVLPIIHTTYKNKDTLNKLLIVNRSA